MPLSDDSGVTCRIVDFPPVPAELRNKDGVNFMHRTQSVDFGVVLEGRIWCVLDSGEEREVGVGEVVVQRGTEHVSSFQSVRFEGEEGTVGDGDMADA